jgi:hypothetical protein
MKTIVGFTVGALATLALTTAADAQVDQAAQAMQGGGTRCFFHYTLFFGLNNTGNVSARAGTPCIVWFKIGPHSGLQERSGFDAITSVVVTQRPRNGAARVSYYKFVIFQPKPGFTGKDSMTVHYTGHGQGQPRETTVAFAIDVHQ